MAEVIPTPIVVVSPFHCIRDLMRAGLRGTISVPRCHVLASAAAHISVETRSWNVQTMCSGRWRAATMRTWAAVTTHAFALCNVHHHVSTRNRRRAGEICMCASCSVLPVQEHGSLAASRHRRQASANDPTSSSLADAPTQRHSTSSGRSEKAAMAWCCDLAEPHRCRAVRFEPLCDMLRTADANKHMPWRACV